MELSLFGAYWKKCNQNKFTIISVLLSRYFWLMLLLYFISQTVTCVMSFNSKFLRLFAHCYRKLVSTSYVNACCCFHVYHHRQHQNSIFYLEACVDTTSADQYVTFSHPFSFVFAYNIFALLMAHYRQCQYGGWHNVVTVSRVVGQVSSLSVGMVAQCRFCQ